MDALAGECNYITNIHVFYISNTAFALKSVCWKTILRFISWKIRRETRSDDSIYKAFIGSWTWMSNLCLYNIKYGHDTPVCELLLVLRRSPVSTGLSFQFSVTSLHRPWHVRVCSPVLYPMIVPQPYNILKRFYYIAWLYYFYEKISFTNYVSPGTR